MAQHPSMSSSPPGTGGFGLCIPEMVSARTISITLLFALWAGISGSTWVSWESLSAMCRARGFAPGAVACRENIRREMEIGRERLRVVSNTVGGGKQRIKHTKNCIPTTQMTVILICKCLPSWKSCHK